jgi:hypothetical protein
MKKVLAAFLALGAIQLAVSPAFAANETFEIVKDKEAVTLDPAAAYLLVESPAPVPLTFFRPPTDEERKADDANRAEALAKQHGKWEKQYARWQAEMKRFKPNPNYPDPPKAPIEPTDETFPWQALEISKMIYVGPLNRFRKSDGTSLFLQKVPAGEYVFYGTISLGQGTCACMGSVKFDVVPGKVTTLRYDYAFLDGEGKLLGHDLPPGTDDDDALARAAMILGNVDDKAHDPRIPDELFTPAELKAVSSMPNWFGAYLNRLQPIDGVLAYERDKVIDLKAQAARP